jgi:hypothetical protein
MISKLLAVSVGLLMSAVAIRAYSNVDNATPVAASQPAGPSMSLSSIGGSISQSEILDRAQYWVDQGYIYSPHAPSSYTFSDDASGKSYRNDCSGLVSEAWHLSTSYVTGDFNVDNSLWHTISWDSMQPGDAYVRQDSTVQHMELFAFWDDPNDHSKGFEKYSFNTNNYTVENPYTLNNFGKSGHRSYDPNGFHAIRYNNIIDDGFASPLLAYSGSSSTVLYRWSSSGTSFPAYSTATYSSLDMANVGNRIASGDVNGDGKTDTVMAYQNSDGTFSLKVLLNGTRAPVDWYTSGPFNLGPVGGRLVVGDVNGDGLADVVLAYDNGSSTVLYRWYSTGTGFPSYSTATYSSLDMANVGDRVAMGDVNGDGRADTVMAYQNSDGTFSYKVFLSGTSAPVNWYTSGPFNLGPVGDRLILGSWL